MRRVVVSWSSGKDATLTLLRLLERDDIHVVGLFTTHVDRYVPFQGTPIEVAELQAKRCGLPLITIALPEVFPANEVYQRLVVEGLANSGIEFDSLAFGDIYCNGIAEYRQAYVEAAGWQCLFPLLAESSESLANDLLARGVDTVLMCVDSERLGDEFLGRYYSKALLEALPKGVDLCGEEGEFHSLVLNAPCFDRAIAIELADIDTQGRFHMQRYRVVEND
ncbi:ATPase [Aliagarivorans taiwanensis]|uniref:Dph6-related ATP pyrophosphatase n=1 Tax=Aliagarivorans taiwanensis TaxID=561966 RepID=UPI000408E159|nr:ATPase [Aliagarivorans taiwanensis]